MPEHFISESIRPADGMMDTVLMASGEPGLPLEFWWRDNRIVIRAVVRRWRTTKSCHHGSGEKYVRKHWFEVATADGTMMKIYFDRQPEGGRKEMGWWLFSVRTPDDDAGPAAG